MTKKQRELLLKVKAKILEEPAQFVMGGFFIDQGNLLSEVYDRGADLPRSVPSCGTAACIAGWTIAISKGKTPRDTLGLINHPSVAASHLLGSGSRKLFYFHYWPIKFHKRWLHNRTLRGRARVAADRIDHFIATDGRE